MMILKLIVISWHKFQSMPNFEIRKVFKIFLNNVLSFFMESYYEKIWYGFCLFSIFIILDTYFIFFFVLFFESLSWMAQTIIYILVTLIFGRILWNKYCRGSRSGTTANKINPYYLIGSIFFYIFIFFILIFQWLITGGTLAYKGSPIANN